MENMAIEKIKSNNWQKLEELQVAERFIKYLNNLNNTDYLLPKYQPPEGSPVDILAYSKSDPKKILKMQVTTSDADVRKSLTTRGRFLRITNSGEPNPLIQKGVLEPIFKKSTKYNQKVKRDLILLLDGWWSAGKLKDVEAENLKILYKNFLRGAGFKEIWIVYLKNSVKLYP